MRAARRTANRVGGDSPSRAALDRRDSAGESGYVQVPVFLRGVIGHG